MTKTVCDICGKDMHVEIYPGSIKDYKFCISSHGRAWDICIECMDELDKWIKKRKAESEEVEEVTLDEAIKHAEEVAEEQEKAAKEWHENQVRKCELFSFAEMDYTHENECKKCAKEHRQLAEWLKELKQLREQTRWIPVSEELPKVADCYDVTRQIGSDLIVSACYFDGIDTWHNGNWTNHERNYLTDVVAWMSRPKPYKTESEDEK